MNSWVFTLIKLPRYFDMDNFGLFEFIQGWPTNHSFINPIDASRFISTLKKDIISMLIQTTMHDLNVSESHGPRESTEEEGNSNEGNRGRNGSTETSDEESMAAVGSRIAFNYSIFLQINMGVLICTKQLMTFPHGCVNSRKDPTYRDPGTISKFDFLKIERLYHRIYNINLYTSVLFACVS